MARVFRSPMDIATSGPVTCGMRPTDVQQIGQELAIKWEDGSESFVALDKLRLHCPCAGCKGEVDVMGKLYKAPETRLSPQAFQLRRIVFVGSYGIQPTWNDGHSTGIYTFDYLKRIAERENS